jgi:3-hydroxymyristoyl/3-hydroxydecanoyl-(acyl carrier protein) dehydratase
VRAADSQVSGPTAHFCIAVDHPALPGHFPGAPVVPGVLLLAEGLRQLELLVASSIHSRRIESAKFLQPVAAGATITAKLTVAGGGRARVEFWVAGTLVAHLKFIVATPDTIHG